MSGVPAAELSASEIRDLNERKKSLRFTNEQYLRDHPELQKLLHDFVCQVLEERPQNLVGFAATYFSQKETPKS